MSAPETLVLTSLYRPLGGPPVPERMNATASFPWSIHLAASGKIEAVSSKQAEDVLRSSEARVAAAAGAAGLGFNEADGNGSVRYILRQLSEGATL